MKSKKADKISAAYFNSAAPVVLTTGCIAPAATKFASSGGNLLVLTLAALVASLTLHWCARRLAAGGGNKRR